MDVANSDDGGVLEIFLAAHDGLNLGDVESGEQGCGNQALGHRLLSITSSGASGAKKREPFGRAHPLASPQRQWVAFVQVGGTPLPSPIWAKFVC